VLGAGGELGALVLGRDIEGLSGDDFRHIHRAAGIVEALGQVFLPIHPEAVVRGYELSQEIGVATADLGTPAFLEALAERLAPSSLTPDAPE